MENKNRLKWIIPLCYIVAIIVCSVLIFTDYVLITFPLTVSLILTGIVFGIGALIVRLVFWTVKKLKGIEIVLDRWQKMRTAIVSVLLFVMLLILNWFVGAVLLVGEDPFYVIFQGADPYKIKTEYDEEWMIDKTYDEIVERYGEFDRYAAYAIKYEDDMDDEDSPTVYLILTFDEGEDGVLDGHDVCIGTRRGKQ